MSRKSLTDQQRRTRAVSRRWVKGYCSDELMRDAALALAAEYEDFAKWHATSTALQKRYTTLAAQYAAQARSFKIEE